MRSLGATAITAMIVGGVLLIASCSNRSPTSPYVPRISTPGGFYGLWENSFVDGAEFFTTGGDPATQIVSMDVEGLPFVAGLFAVGPEYDPRYVDAGTVRVWQSPPLAGGVDTLARRSALLQGTPWYLYTSKPNLPALPPIAFDGLARHHFKVSGSGEIPAFEDSILSVKRPVISAPAVGATVPRNTDLVVRWSDAGTDTSVRVFGFVWSANDSFLAPGVGDARDPDGQARVDFSHAYLPAGGARLTVIRYRVVHRTVGTTGVVLKCEGIVHQTLLLQ